MSTLSEHLNGKSMRNIIRVDERLDLITLRSVDWNKVVSALEVYLRILRGPERSLGREEGAPLQAMTALVTRSAVYPPVGMNQARKAIASTVRKTLKAFFGANKVNGRNAP